MKRIIFGLIAIAISAVAFAQQLTDPQVAMLRTSVLADPALAPKCTSIGDGPTDIATAYNAPATPAYTVWRGLYTQEQIRAAITDGVTQLDSLAASKRDSLLWWAGGNHDARRTQVRAAIDDLTGSQTTLKAALQDGAKRTATRGEKLFATGSGTFALPSVSAIEGPISIGDVIRACP